MKNENEIKQRFAALYLHQVVFNHPDYTNKYAGVQKPVQKLTLSIIYGSFINKGWLELRDISDLKPDELEIVAKLDLIEDEETYDELKVIGLHVIDWYGRGITTLGYKLADYLRSIGILLPITYLDENQKPVTLSTDEILKLGWAVTGKEK